MANNDTTNRTDMLVTAQVAYQHGKEIDQLNSDLNKIDVYVGEDNRLHFVDCEGADSALPFNQEIIKIDRLDSSNGDGNNSNSVAQLTLPNKKHIEIGTIGLNNPSHYNTTMHFSVTANGENIYSTDSPASNIVREVETPTAIKLYLSGWQTYVEDIVIY